MNARVEAVMEMAKTWPTEDQAELLDALFGLVSPAGGELEAQWVNECEDRFTADVDKVSAVFKCIRWHGIRWAAICGAAT